MLFFSLITDLAASNFISQPSNVTVFEGESIRINCTSTMNGIAIWIIDGLQYYWSEFKTIDLYTFNRADNSLLIHDSPRTLDGSSYKCVLNQEESSTGYLTVLYEVPNDTVPTISPSPPAMTSHILESETSTSK